jgi:cell division protein FtsL
VRTSPYRWYFGSVSIFVLGALLYVWCHVKTLSQGEEITTLRDEREGLIRKREVLDVEIAGLQKASRIRQIAAIELGMRFPAEHPNNLYTTPGQLANGLTVSDAGR